MENLKTKEKIEYVALDLFAKYGYSSVSIRDICKKIGVKESSIYYHFKNKQAIMESLIALVEEKVEGMKEQFNQAFSGVTEVSEEAMVAVSVGILNNYLLSPFIYKMISALSIERMNNQRDYELYNRIVFDLPLQHQEKVFAQMMERGIIKDNEPKLLAAQYYAIIYLEFQRHCLGHGLDEERANLARNAIGTNILDIYRKMKG